MNNELIKKIINNKKIIIIIGIILIIGISILLLNRNNIFNNNKSNKITINETKPVVKDIEVESKSEITVISARIEKLDNLSNIFVKVKNNTNNDIDKSELKLTVLDKDNNVLTVSYVKKINDFKVGEEREFQVSSTDNLSNAYKYIIEKN